MKNEKDTIRALFEDITLSDEEITRMEQQILHPAEKTRKYRRKLRLGPLAAAILVMVLSLTAISAAPAIRKYFFPGVGVVEVTGEEEAAPLYMMLDTAEHPVGNYELLAGYWHNGTAKAWIRSQTRYEELPEEDLFSHTDAVLTLESFANAPGSPTNTPRPTALPIPPYPGKTRRKDCSSTAFFSVSAVYPRSTILIPWNRADCS